MRYIVQHITMRLGIKSCRAPASRYVHLWIHRVLRKIVALSAYLRGNGRTTDDTLSLLRFRFTHGARRPTGPRAGRATPRSDFARARLCRFSGWFPAAAAEPANVIPPPAVDAPAAAPGDGLQTVVLAGGCFWGIQAVYQHVEGVRQAVSGYAGGAVADPTYEQVSSGRTGHAESVQVTFDPHKVSLGKILQVSSSRSPMTRPSSTGRVRTPERNTGRRSSPPTIHQARRAGLCVAARRCERVPAADRDADRPAGEVLSAEAYHQDYALTHPHSPYIMFNDLPKVDNLKRLFPEVYREQPVTVAAAAGKS